MVWRAQCSGSRELSRGPLRYLDADARSRGNNLGEEVTARLRGDWSKLGGWNYKETLCDCTGLDL
jgi:hypothetical protein